MYARATGNQEVAGSTPAGSATFFREDLIMKFSTVILSLPLIQKGQFLVSGEIMCKILVNRLDDCLPSESVVRLTDRALDMTPSESESEYFTDDTSIDIHSPGPKIAKTSL